MRRTFALQVAGASSGRRDGDRPRPTSIDEPSVRGQIGREPGGAAVPVDLLDRPRHLDRCGAPSIEQGLYSVCTRPPSGGRSRSASQSPAVSMLVHDHHAGWPRWEAPGGLLGDPDESPRC